MAQFVFIALVLVLSAAPAQADGIPYTLEILVRAGETIGGKTLATLGAVYSLNEAGTIAFTGCVSGQGCGIFTQSDLVAMSASDASLNDVGTVAFTRSIPGGKGIFTQSGQLLATGDTIGGKVLTSLGSGGLSLNNSDTVAYIAQFSGSEGIFTQHDLLVAAGDTISGKTLNGFGSIVSLNDAGTVAFKGSFAGGDARGVFTQNGLLVATGDTLGGKTLTNIDPYVSLNNLGTVAFRGDFAGGDGIFTQNALLVASGDTIGGKTLFTFDFPIINDAGTVAFIGKISNSNESGIFTQTGFRAATGDTVGGKTLADFGPPRINNRGQIAFPVVFDDGGVRTEGIVLATPVPESGTLILLGTGLAAMAGWKRKRLFRQ